MVVRRKEIALLAHIIKDNCVLLFALQLFLNFFYWVLSDPTTLKKKGKAQKKEKRKLFSKRSCEVISIHFKKFNLRIIQVDTYINSETIIPVPLEYTYVCLGREFLFYIVNRYNQIFIVDENLKHVFLLH